MAERVLDLPGVIQATSLRQTAIYEAVSGGHFPKPIKLVGRRVGWLGSEIDAWIARRTAERDATPSDAPSAREAR